MDSRINIDQLSDLHPLKSSLIIVLEWMLIVLSFYVYIWLGSDWILLFLIPFIATRMYALYSLLHDGLHFLLLKNKKINDLLATVFLATPLFLSLTTMRKNHFLHHQHLKDELDPEMAQMSYPEFSFPLKKMDLFVIILKDLTGFNFMKYKAIRIKRLWTKEKDLVQFFKGVLSFQLFVFIVLVLLFWKLALLKAFFLLWIIPYITIYQALNRFRLYFEHQNLEGRELKTRSMSFGALLDFFVCPHNLGYHTEHHLYPKVPFYNLKALRGELTNKDELVMERNIVKLIEQLYEK